MKSPSRKNSRKLLEWLNSHLWGSNEAQVILNQTPESEGRLSWISLEILTAQFLASFLETRCHVSGSSAIKAGESYMRQSYSDVPEEISSSPEGS